MLIATSTLHLSHIAAWIAVGLIMGGLSGKLIEIGGYGVGGDLLFGALGAMFGGASARLLLGRTEAFWIPVLVALAGAGIFTCAARIIVARLNR